MLNNEKLRVINAKFPDIVERLITLFGSQGFTDYISSLVRGAENGSMPHLTEEITLALITIKTDHDQSFPQYAGDPTANYPEKCVQNPNFQVINQKFGRIGRQLAEKWGQHAFADYINELLTDTRGGRQGFPHDILSALFALMKDHEKEFPELAPKQADVWSLQMKE